jgi:hypothetical protein
LDVIGQQTAALGVDVDVDEEPEDGIKVLACDQGLGYHTHVLTAGVKDGRDVFQDVATDMGIEGYMGH